MSMSTSTAAHSVTTERRLRLRDALSSRIPREHEAALQSYAMNAVKRQLRYERDPTPPKGRSHRTT